MKRPDRSHILLPDSARAELRRATIDGIDVLERTIANLQERYPGAFQSTDTLFERGFIYEPKECVPYRWHMYDAIPPWASR